MSSGEGSTSRGVSQGETVNEIHAMYIIWRGGGLLHVKENRIKQTRQLWDFKVKWQPDWLSESETSSPTLE